MSQREDQSEEERRKISGLVVCPRCGLPGWAYVRDDRYVYVYHRIRLPSGRKRIKHCYLGPVGTYRHTYVTNQLQLRGLIDPYRYLKYLKMIILKIAEFASVEDPEERKTIVQQLREAQNMLTNIIKLFESLESETQTS